MGMFSIREPRRFEHKYIYYDERKEKLEKIEEKAKKDLGMLPKETFNPDDIRGKFLEGTKHLKKFKESGGSRLSTKVLILSLIALFLLLHYLITGEFLF
jgi:hypothetical protein